MNNKKHLIIYELKNGILLKWYKFVPLSFVVFAFCFDFYKSISAKTLTLTGESTVPSFMDYIIYLLEGMYEYIPRPDNPFTVPVIWFTLHFYIATVVANYSVHDINGFGKHVLIQNESREKWFFNKCIWVISSVIVCFLMVYSAPFIISLFTGRLSFAASGNSIIIEDLKADFTAVDKNDLIYISFLLPILTSITVSLIQLLLEFVLRPIYSYMIVICFWIASAYFCSPLLFGNSSMLLRFKYFTENGFDILSGVITDIVLIIAVIIIGILYFRKYDIIDKE